MGGREAGGPAYETMRVIAAGGATGEESSIHTGFGIPPLHQLDDGARAPVQLCRRARLRGPCCVLRAAFSRFGVL